MHRLILIGILMVAIALPVYAGNDHLSSTSPVRSTWLTVLPAGWLMLKSDVPQCLMLCYDSKHKDQFVMMSVVYNVTGDMTLDEIFKLGEQSAPKVMENYRLLEHGYTKVGGLAAYYVYCTSTVGDWGKVKSKSYVVIRKAIAYTFTFSCVNDHFAEHTKDFDSIIKSIKWMEPPAK